MANFKTHIQASTILSGVASSILFELHILNVSEAIYCWLAGSLGGILPDIDSDNSHSLSIMFGLLSVAVCLGVFVFLSGKYTLPYLWGAVAAAYIILNTIIRYIFERLTVHRGGCHSVLMGLLCVCAGVNATYYMNTDKQLSWLIGLFIGLGFLTHLVLDELYAVDFSGARIKRSFGTALKLFDIRNKSTTVCLFILLGINVYFLPPHRDLINTLNISITDYKNTMK